MNNSLLLCIGIDEYQDRAIDKLSYCVADCFRAERVFNLYNIADTFVTLTNQDATREKILSVFNFYFPKFKNIYIYYSAHGKNIDKKSYLYTYDTNQNNLKDSSISLCHLISNVQTSNKATLIIDACGIIYPEHNQPNLKIYFPSFLISYEDSLLRQSLFTKGILEILSKENLYNYNANKNRRYQRIRQELSSYIMNKHILFVIGKSGLGKSHFLRQIKNEEKHTFYVSLPKIVDLTFDIVLSLINEEFSLSSQSGHENIIDVVPERYIRFYSNMHPYSLLIIDHIDYLSYPVTYELLNFLDSLPIQKIIASRSNNSQENNIYNFPLLTKDDLVESVEEMGICDVNQLNQTTIYNHDNYIDLLKDIENYKRLPIADNTDESNSIKRTSEALIVSGGYINEDLFIKIFNLNRGAVQKLKHLGLIMYHENFFYPHDSIYSNNSEVELSEMLNLACTYWKSEIKEGQTAKAIQSFILLANTFVINISSDECEIYKIMIEAMQGRQNTYFLLLLNEHLKDKEISMELRFFLCESLIDIGRFDEAQETINNDKSISLDLFILNIELLWWRGKFTECIDLATQLLSNTLAIDKELHVLCSRGIGYFFLGRWDESSRDLEKVIHTTQLYSEKVRYLSCCVLATIQGLRGTNLSYSVENFINALIYAKKSGKLSWLAVVYGNIGEMLWKAGFYEKSNEVLTTSSHLAYLTDNVPLYLEINRNLLHVYHRSTQTMEVKQQLLKLEGLFGEQSDNYVKMQIINTLITHYIFDGDPKYKNYIETVQELTCENAEYHIYTLSNIAIAKLFENHLKLATLNIEKALELCFIGKNWLAVKQCLDDWDKTIYSHCLDSDLQSRKLFQKWHQILEIELEPYLHHLSHLCEYLQSP